MKRLRRKKLISEDALDVSNASACCTAAGANAISVARHRRGQDNGLRDGHNWDGADDRDG